MRRKKTVNVGTIIQRGGYLAKSITEGLSVSRSYQYEKRRGIVRVRHYRKADNERYLVLIRQICDKRPTYGYRRITAVLNRVLRERGESGLNHKRVYRIMRIHNLLLQRHTVRPACLHEGTVITLRSNMQLCSDVFEIAYWNKERVRVAFSMDYADREVLSYIATTGGIHRDLVKDLMTEAIDCRFRMVDKLPYLVQWLSDNSLAYIAQETLAFAKDVGLDVRTTPYYSPESNGMAEAFIKTFKRDYVRLHELPDALTMIEQLPWRFEDYNENHPHKGLKMMSQREYKKLMERVH